MLHTIRNAYMTVTAAEKGAELQSILGADGTEYLWQGDSRYWGDRAPNLFPYVARLTQGSYYLDGKLYKMPIHGIAPYRDFKPVVLEDSRMVLELRSDEETYIQYPRHFAFRVIYSLKDTVLEITYEVENMDGRSMYFGLGGHPGFRVPLKKGKRFEDYRLRFYGEEEPRRIVFTPDCFVTGSREPFPLEGGSTMPLVHTLFDEDAIVLTSVGHQVTIEAEGEVHGVTVTFPQMDNLGLWHWPRTDAPYICIEPWCSLPSRQDLVTVFEEQEDLTLLEPSETYRNSWTIEIHGQGGDPHG